MFSSAEMEKAPHSKFRYIPHLDGLRALAVLAVLLFHFNVPFLKGGYAGVDVFFTLSGFLITSILRTSNAHHFKDLQQFFIKRFYRLYPASILTILITLVLTYLLFSCDLALKAANSAFFAQISFSNVYFHANDNYFDERNTFLKPLLHMWSLSLEEQFYLLWAPFVMFLLNRQSMSTASCCSILGLLIIFSFSLAMAFRKRNPSFIFYEFPPRIFQFAIGAFSSFIYRSPGESKSGLINAQSTSSRKLFLKSLWCNRVFTRFFSPKSSQYITFRGKDYIMKTIIDAFSILIIYVLLHSFIHLPMAAAPHLILPTSLSTAVLILMPSTAISSQILSLPFMRFLGRISYSAYLVHWPIFVFSNYIFLAIGHPNKLLNVVCLLSASFGLAYLMFQFVEEPFRMKRTKSKNLILAALVISSFGLSILGIVSKGYSFRKTGKIDHHFQRRWMHGTPRCAFNSIKKKELYANGVTELHCGRSPLRESLSRYSVVRQNRTQRQNNLTVFVGNSYISMWHLAFARIALKKKVFFKMFYKGGCPFVPLHHVNELERKCHKPVRYMWKKIVELPPNTNIGLSFPFLKDETQYKRYVNLTQVLKSYGLKPFVISITPGATRSIFPYFACSELVKMPIGRLIFGDSGKPWIEKCVPNLVNGAKPLSIHHRLNSHILPRRLCKTYKIPYLSLFEWLCDESNHLRDIRKMNCKMPADFSFGHFDIGYHRDLHHLTAFGAFSLTKFMEKGLTQIGVVPN